MLNSKRLLFTVSCASGLLGLVLTAPAVGQSQGEGAAGHELQQGWEQLLEERARAEEEATLRGLPLVSVNASDQTASEPDDPGVFTITRSGVLAGDLQVHYVVRGNAVNGTDYRRLSGQVQILDGQASATIVVSVLDDGASEPLERVSIEIIPDPGYVVGTPRTALVRLADDDISQPQPLAAATAQVRQAVDVSHWSGSGWGAECFVENGVTHLIAGTQNPTITRAQLATAVAAGMTVDAYVYLYWGSNITTQVQNALATIEGFPVTRLWLDAENSASGYSSSQILQKIQEGLDACGAQPCGIYTAKWWWDPSTNYSAAFAGVPLWYARYDLTPSFNDWYNGVSDFGGWTDPTGKQYQGSNYFCGVNVDKNIMKVTAAPTAAFKGETGRVTTSQADGNTWQSVAFENAYTAPVVVMQPLSYNGGDPTTVRIRNVTSTGFQWQMDEWDYRDGAHTTETVSYVAMESGVFELEDGTRIEVGRVATDHGFTSVAFGQAFAGTPLVLSQVQTHDDPAAVVTRQRGASATGFEVRVQEEEANDPVHALETVGYIAIETGVGMTGGVVFEAATTPDAVTHAWYPLAFLQSYGDPVFVAGLQTTDGGDTAGLRYRNLASTSAEVMVEEEKSGDGEVGHTTEVVGYLVFDHPGSLVGPGSGENPPPAPTGLSPDGGQEFPNGGSVTLSANPVSGATQYEFAIEHDSGGGAWATYWTYTSDASSFTFWPQYPDRAYRFRVRAENAYGWGSESVWATFVVGTAPGNDPPPAPTGLSPDGGEAYPNGSSVTLSSQPISDATQYEFAIEHDSGGGLWATYWSYTSSTSSFTFWPQYPDRNYRFRVRAENEYGWGPQSAWATFTVGTLAGPPPAPTGLSPDGGQAYPAGGAVVLGCTSIPDATQYEFAIEYFSGGVWKTYYAYTTSGSAKTFYPAVHGTDYRFRVRAENEHGWGAYSVWASFHVSG